MRSKVLSIMLIPFLLFLAPKTEAAVEDNWRDETIYYVVIDRFNNGDFNNDFAVDASDPTAYHGGDFKGITLQLDYIKDMGFTAIALSPIFDNEEKGYHGYWIKDFYKPEEHFGTLAEFKKLVKEAHKRDMKVIVDFPVNTVGANHPWLQDAQKQDWFDEKRQTEDSLPSLNHENSEVKAFLIDVAKWWIEETDIDGYKLEQVQYVSTSFLEELTNEVKKIDPEFFLMGDVKSEKMEEFSEVGFDGVLDYPSNEVLRGAFAKPDQPTEELFSLMEKNNELFKSPYLLGTFMDNQWTERFTRYSVENNLHPGTRWKLALTYLYTTPGIPIVYYGSEIALDGGLGDDNRRQMDFRTDKELVDYITLIGKIRNQLPALTKGSMDVLYSEGGMTVYKREFEGEISVVAINNTTKSQNISLKEEQLRENMELRGLVTEDLVKSKNGEYQLIIDRDEAEIYYLANKSGFNIPLISAVSAVYIAFVVFLILLVKRRRRAAK